MLPCSPRLDLSIRFTVPLLLLALSGVSALQASPFVTTTVSTTTQTSPGGYTVSSVDLINTGSLTLASAVPNVAGYFNFGGYTQLNNGAVGSPNTSGNMTDAATSFGADAYVTYTLQGSATGYSITEIDTMAGWSDQRIWQTIQIDVATLSNPTFTPISFTNANFNSNQAYRYTPAFSGLPGSSSRLRFADSVSPGVAPIATGVTAVRIHILSNNGTAEPGSYREFDVFGSATAIPETAWPALLVIGGVGLLVRWRRS